MLAAITSTRGYHPRSDWPSAASGPRPGAGNRDPQSGPGCRAEGGSALASIRPDRRRRRRPDHGKLGPPDGIGGRALLLDCHGTGGGIDQDIHPDALDGTDLGGIILADLAEIAHLREAHAAEAVEQAGLH